MSIRRQTTGRKRQPPQGQGSKRAARRRQPTGRQRKKPLPARGSARPSTGTRSRTPRRPASGATRVGIGYDSHRFGPGGPLTLGGVNIPVEFSLIGHSDGDAVAHAVTDAVLGAAALGDIGELFSDTDPANRKRDSIEMLVVAVRRVQASGWSVVSADVTIIAETPKIAEYRDPMRARLAEALGLSKAQVSVKGKTNERMGWVGRGEGLACIAIALLESVAPVE